MSEGNEEVTVTEVTITDIKVPLDSIAILVLKFALVSAIIGWSGWQGYQYYTFY